MTKLLKFWWDEVKWVYEMDPSCKSVIQAFLLFPGTKARRSYILAHWLYKKNIIF